jgi:hypothetical protein
MRIRLEDAIILTLYFLFNPEGLNTQINKEAFLEANKVIELETSRVMDLINDEGID